MRALVVEEKGKIRLRDIDIHEELGPRDVRVKLSVVGICASDVHYFTDGQIGDFVVREPMILGHEAAGTVIEVGSDVTDFRKGDRVCMEPTVPSAESFETRSGRYNLDPEVRCWATPPVHGVLRESVVHPAAYTYKLPDNVSFAEGAMIEPLAVGLQALSKVNLAPGDVALVIGAGTVGLVTALSALAAGCSRVIITDVVPEKLALAEKLGAITGVSSMSGELPETIRSLTSGRGVAAVFECSGNKAAAESVFAHVAPGGTVVFVGLPDGPIKYDIIQGAVKEVVVHHVFRYANVFPSAIALVGSQKIDVKPLITDRFPFDKSVEAFDAFLNMGPSSVKIQIDMTPGD